MTTSDLKTLLKGNHVQFSRYRKGYLYYTISEAYSVDLPPPNGIAFNTYEFPVPIEDVGDATFGATEKALLFMRYIRKAQEEGSFARV